jgi:hypothetical protein
MLRWIIAIFILVPAIEITMLIMLGHLVGGWMTFLLIIASGFLGAYFAKREGRKVMEYAKFEWSQGQLPAQQILDGIVWDHYTGSLRISVSCSSFLTQDRFSRCYCWPLFGSKSAKATCTSSIADK